MMTRDEALKMLNESPMATDDRPSRLNSGLTRRQSVEIVRAAVMNHVILPRWLEKRVYQASRNQKRVRV